MIEVRQYLPWKISEARQEGDHYRDRSGKECFPDAWSIELRKAEVPAELSLQHFRGFMAEQLGTVGRAGC